MISSPLKTGGVSGQISVGAWNGASTPICAGVGGTIDNNSTIGTGDKIRMILSSILLNKAVGDGDPNLILVLPWSCSVILESRHYCDFDVGVGVMICCCYDQTLAVILGVFQFPWLSSMYHKRCSDNDLVIFYYSLQYFVIILIQKYWWIEISICCYLLLILFSLRTLRSNLD